MRKAGVLMPIASLPSDFGIGDLGKNGYRFIDLLKKAGIKIWQILPLNPLGYGNSPYQPYSSFAGDEIYIDLIGLFEEGLLKEAPHTNNQRGPIDYTKARAWKHVYLRKAYEDGYAKCRGEEEFGVFLENDWVYPYAVFAAFKKASGGLCWNQWKQQWQDFKIGDAITDPAISDEINYQLFIQYLFYKQWLKLKSYANGNGIEIMGDVPFYVGLDSADVWQCKEGFLLDEKNVPTHIAGVPPDYFSKTGQRWGNPIYDWEYLTRTDYAFWVKRLSYSARLYDIVRIDHFRAFDTYWKVPASCPTAVEGEWMEAPGYEFFHTLFEKEKGIHIVAEDLGDLRKEVLDLRDAFGFKGMNVVQFNFFNEEDKEVNRIAYTGTHDNQTTLGWYKEQKVATRWKIRKILREKGLKKGSVVSRIVTYTMQLAAEFAIIPIQDFLELPDRARMNTPGTVGSPNWEWKLDDLEEFAGKVDNIRKMVEETDR